MSTVSSQTIRVLELLKRFNSGQKVYIESLLNDPVWYGKSEKTIRRDLNVIKEYFPESFELIRGGKGEKGCYKAITQSAFDNFLKPSNLSLLVQTFNIVKRSNLFDCFEIGLDEKKIIESKIEEMNKYYEFKNSPLEDKIKDYSFFKKFEHAIKHRKYIIIEYPENNDKYKKIEVKPYKIIFMNENFYIACAVDYKYEFSIFRISKIRSIEDTNKTYQKSADIEDYIKFMQTPFSRYARDFKKHLIDVIVEIDKGKAYFFKSKRFLKSQEIIKERDDGGLVVKFQVTQLLEIESLIKEWVPYIKVVKPIVLKEKIIKDYKKYLEL